MSASRNRFVSMLLVAFWLLATQHCVLEAAGLFEDGHAAEAGAGCCRSQVNGCETDGCKVVEDGQFRSEVKIVKAAAPELTACVCLLCSNLLSASSEREEGFAAKDRRNEPPVWVPSWQFERRAAAPAHAPDSLIA